MVVELRDSQGTLTQSKKTDSSGWYSFPTPPAGTSFLNVATDRNQVATPSQARSVSPSSYTFTVKGVPATIRVTGPAGSFVLLTTFTYTGAAPPIMDQVNAGMMLSLSSAVGLNGFVDLSVPRGDYQLVCWKPQIINNRWAYSRAPASNSTGAGGLREPQSFHTVSCP
jgi:hypothetical protein